MSLTPPSDAPTGPGPVRQLSLFGTEAADPSPADLAGLLAGPAQIVRMGGTARLSVVVDVAWRVHVLVAELARRGLNASWEATGDGHRVRTSYTSALAPLAASWLSDGPVPDGPPPGTPASRAATADGDDGAGGRPDAADRAGSGPDGDGRTGGRPDGADRAGSGPDGDDGAGGRPDGDGRVAGPPAAAEDPVRKRPPATFHLNGRRLRLWVAAAGVAEPSGFRLHLGPADEPCWETVGRALAAVGLPSTFLDAGAEGPAYRISGRRRLARLAELVGDRPVAAPVTGWPSGPA
ncbi:hypothetical protein GA0070618_1563 [Micromonospora echinospora]|uniref:Uncharacterized protein n=1 Tax=Micromonospora echinospora TaxID=1877 RepID=A0A1C4VUG1_MICEC|nr:hypothetical protein GA0070618_1563 [Micromonospora echinospora]